MWPALRETPYSAFSQLSALCSCDHPRKWCVANIYIIGWLNFTQPQQCSGPATPGPRGAALLANRISIVHTRLFHVNHTGFCRRQHGKLKVIYVDHVVHVDHRMLLLHRIFHCAWHCHAPLTKHLSKPVELVQSPSRETLFCSRKPERGNCWAKTSCHIPGTYLFTYLVQK